MTMNSDLFKAILAMDAYSRGYAPGISGLGGKGTQIGNATVGDDSGILGAGLDSAAGFYAVAYTLPGGEKIISYRGTDKKTSPIPFWSGTPGGDIFNGWGVGAGDPGAAQAALAVEFYKAVANTSGAALQDANISLTGHSLGGGFVCRSFNG